MVDDVRPAYADDEIDLVELLQTIWDGKWTVVGIAVLAAVFGGLFAFLRPASFVATTEIKPITSTQAQAYRANNALGFFEISPAQLRGLFIEQLEERSFFEAAIRKHELIARADFESDADYEAAIVALAAEIAIQPPVNVDGEEKGEIRRNWSVLFEGTDADKWLAVLKDVKQGSTEAVRSGLVDRFNTALAVSRQSKAFQLEDIETRMENAKADFDKQMREFELNQSFLLEDIETLIQNAKRDFDLEMEEFEMKRDFELEDVETNINNALADYERKTADRLAFLGEQAAIARKLGVAKNTLEAQMFSSSNGVVANVKADTPFYLRGYEAIEKEIELITTREDKRAFVTGLLELEQTKRSLEQDRTLERAAKRREFQQTLLELERQKRKLEQDQTLQRADAKVVYLDAVKALEVERRGIEQDESLARAQTMFDETPALRAEQFNAVQMEVLATEIESKSKRSLILALSLVLGGMVGVIFVLIRSAMRKRKTV